MNNIGDFVSTLGRSDARSALYYLSRFLKQAAHYHDYRKDIFEDDERSAPSASARAATLAMIAMIEEAEGVAIIDFDDETYSRWATRVRDLEKQLDPELTENDLARVREFTLKLGLPDTKG